MWGALPRDAALAFSQGDYLGLTAIASDGGRGLLLNDNAPPTYPSARLHGAGARVRPLCRGQNVWRPC